MFRLAYLVPRRLAVLCFVLLAAAPLGFAQETAGPAASVAAPAPASTSARQVSLEQLQELRTQLEQGGERVRVLLDPIDPSAAEAWLSESPLDRLRERGADSNLPEAERAFWQEAVEHEQAAVERVRGALNRVGLATSSPDRLQVAEERVEAMLASLAPSGDDAQERSISQIDQELASLRSLRLQVGLDLNQSRQALQRLEEQTRAQGETLAQLQREREALVNAQADADGNLSEGRLALNTALERRSNANLLSAQLDAQSIPARVERLRLEVQTKELEDIWLGARIEALQLAFNQRSTEELRALSAAVQALIDSAPEVSERFVSELTVLRQQIDQIGFAQERIRDLQQQRDEARQDEDELKQTLANVRERLAIGGLTETLGSQFLEEQRRLRVHDDKRFALRRLEQELSQSRLRNINLREQLLAFPLNGQAGDEDPAGQELQRLQQQTLSALLQTDGSLADQLRQTEMQLRALVGVVEELDQVLRETLIWWPSHSPVGVAWLLKIPPALLALLEPTSWQEIYTAFLRVTIGSPAPTLLILILVGLIYRLGQGTGANLRALAEKTRHRFTDNIKLTFKAMGWSVLRVLPGPVLLALTSWRLEQISGTAPGVEILASVLFSAAIWWLAGHLLLIFTSRNGVGTVHFEWHPALVRRARRNLAWYLPAQFLLILCLTLAFVHPSELVFDVLGRVGLVAAGILTGILAWRLLAPDPAVELSPGRNSRRRFLRLLAITFAAGIIILTLAGYLLTVTELFSTTIDTMVVLGLVWLCYRLATRALVLSEERLRVRRMREERAKAAAMESSAGENVTDVPEPHLSLEDINHQTLTLVKVTAGSVMALALFLVWAEILPALTWLDGVTLWTRTITVGEAEILSDVSLQDILLAGGLGVLLLMAARNLPGLVEILLMRTTQMDASGRYTMATLLRYVIIVFMVISVFSLLGLRWSELQWMVAALTLGLGFGLQEVVANFVSGLIMLFERPVRVGDTITIGEFSGTVGRIRTRATTIIDWDNREVVVPNKNFITERLINWSLSDTVTRIVIPVNVRYDADPEVVIACLQEIAEKHPMVLQDPAPTCFLLRLGENAMQFELRAFVAQLRDRLDTMSALHRSILQAFREKNIIIAFPQMDLHIRNLPESKGQPQQVTTLPALID